MLLTADWRDGLGESSAARRTCSISSCGRRPPSPTSCWRWTRPPPTRASAACWSRLAETANGLGATQELRDAVERFRAAGKFAIAYADSFGELSSGNEGYYLATAFDEIDLQPVGLVGLTGLAAQVPLARDLLASLGIGVRGAAPRRIQDGAGEPDRQPADRPRTASSSTPCSTR